jgi:hypothetical protein
MKIQRHAGVHHSLSVITTDSIWQDTLMRLITRRINQQKSIDQSFSPPGPAFCTLFSLTHQLPGVYTPAHNDVISLG